MKNEEDGSRLSSMSLCCTCRYFGKYVRRTKYKGKEWTDIHECDLHPGCLNSYHSIQCSDYIAK